MAEVIMSAVIRKILSTNLDLAADEVVKRAKARGVTAPDKSIRTNVHNIKSQMKKDATAAKPVPSAARETARPKVAPAAAPVVETPAPALKLSGVLDNVARVSKVVTACGGVENARKAAEAVEACGSVAAFLQHLELVASIRPTESQS